MGIYRHWQEGALACCSVGNAKIDICLLLQRVSIACYAEHYTSYSKSVHPSVCLSIRHTLALCQNDSGYHYAVLHCKIAP